MIHLSLQLFNIDTMNEHLTLFQLQGAISQTLKERFALPVWVSCEISDMKVNYSGHCYLELIEKGESDGVAKAQAKGVIWRSGYSRIVELFEAQSGARLERGVKILAKVMVNFHELYGLSLQIIDIDPTYTLGDMERQRQLTIAQLHKDGVWDMNREVDLPIVAQRIAVISSRSAAGYQDFGKELARGGYHFKVELFDSVMQGGGAEKSIIESLCRVAQREDEFDLLVIIRGGGSTIDLNCFNSYRLGSYVAQFPLPIIAGIGHDKDISVVDLVAHTTLKTPTAVAGWLVERVAQIDGWLDGAAQNLHDGAIAATRRYELMLERVYADVEVATSKFIDDSQIELNNHTEVIAQQCDQFFQQQKQRLAHSMEIIDSHSPQRLLELGFAIMRSRTNSKAVESVTNVGQGDSIEITLKDGVIGAIVTDIN